MGLRELNIRYEWQSGYFHLYQKLNERNELTFGIDTQGVWSQQSGNLKGDGYMAFDIT